MGEAEQPGMQAEPMNRVVAVAIFAVAADGMAHIGCMHANLVLASSLQLKLDQRMLSCAAEHMEMTDGQLAAIVEGRGLGDVGLVVLQPVLYGAFVLLHLAAEDGYVAAVIYNLMPVVL